MEKVIIQLTVAISAIVSLAFGFWVLFYNLKSRVNVSFFALVFAIFIWAIPNFITPLPSLSDEAVNFWFSVNFIGPAVFVAYLVYFSYVFPDDKKKISWSKIALMFLFPAFVVLSVYGERYLSQTFSLESFNDSIFFFFPYWTSFFLYVFWAFANFKNQLKIQIGKKRKTTLFFFWLAFSNIAISFFFAALLPMVFSYNDLIFLGPGIGGLVFAVLGSFVVVQYNFMEIKAMSRRTLSYAILVIVITAFTTSVVFVSRLLEVSYPDISFWLIPAVFSIVASFFGIFAWNTIKNSEALKYDFITTVTHKFRSPISRIVWAIEGVRDQGNLNDIQKTALRSLEYSTNSILKMVDLMTHISDEKKGRSVLKREIDFSELIKSILKDQISEFNRRGVSLVVHVKSGVKVMAETNSLRFIINVLLENALTYTPSEGVVRVGLFLDGTKAVFSVKDTGIGISGEVKKNIAKSFYRGNLARITDTEGMGIGLHISKKIINSYNGEMDFYSEGEGKGSTFFVKLPVHRVEDHKNKEIKIGKSQNSDDELKK